MVDTKTVSLHDTAGAWESVDQWIGRSGCWIKFKLSIGSVSAQDELVQQSTRKSPLISPPDRWIVGPAGRLQGLSTKATGAFPTYVTLWWPPVCCGCCFLGENMKTTKQGGKFWKMFI